MGLFNKIYQVATDWLAHESPNKDGLLSDFKQLRHDLKPCDVILVQGTSRVAEVIKVVTQSRWSHAALYIGRLHDIEDPLLRSKVKSIYDCQSDAQLMLESELGIGTTIRPIEIYQKKHLRICRPRELAWEDGQQVVNYAINKLGTEYDVRQILDLARFYMPWSFMPRRFRSSLFNWQPGGCTKTVCSTIIAEAFGVIQYPILPLVKQTATDKVVLLQRNPKLNTPSDFDYSPYFDILKFPYMSFSTEADRRYRLMPWQQKEDNEDIGLTDSEKRNYVDTSEHVEMGKQKNTRSINEKQNLHSN
jgi:hypothetical protein